MLASMLLRKFGICFSLIAALALIGFAGSASARAAMAVTVCPSGCAFNQVATAVAAAKDGDTIVIAPGKYNGGFTIDVSLKLVGGGAGKTIIGGGGPVLTIGVAGAASEPTVSIEGVTVTGGVTVGNLDPSNGRGGGIYVPRAAGPSTGATVTIRNSVIRGNTVAPSAATDSGIPCPPDVTITCINGDLPFASAGGGGISNDGTMTLDHTLVTDNRADAASGLTSDADGGGILDRAFGILTLHDSVVSDNHAEVTAPNGRSADSGGILMNGPMLTIDGSLINNNSAQLTTTFPNSVGTDANTGGVHVNGNDNCASPAEGCTVATIRNSTITGNSVTASNSLGDAVDFCGGICDDGQLTLSDSLVSSNQVSASVPAASTACACADSGGIGTGGVESITTTRITGNTVTAAAPAGNAIATNGGGSAGNGLNITINDSLISGNHLTATTTSGTATVTGAGFGNSALLEIRGTTIRDNIGTASGPTGPAQGGGISNVVGPGAPPGQLTLIDSRIIHNTLSGVTLQGGGLFTTVPVTLTNTVIAQNIPDQCFGC
jgi:hypothetical protein